MKRALILLLWIVLAACGGGDPDDTEDRPATIPAPPCSASGACR